MEGRSDNRSAAHLENESYTRVEEDQPTSLHVSVKQKEAEGDASARQVGSSKQAGEQQVSVASFMLSADRRSAIMSQRA